MVDVPHSLKIKYGLSHSPSEEKIKLWVEKTKRYISSGIDAEESGKKAAQEVFPDYESILYATQADTIIALLSEAEKR